MVNNGLKLNQDKTELVPISSKFCSSPSLDFTQADDENVENIQPKSYARDLGLPGRLNQSSIVKKIYVSFHYNLRNVAKIRKCFSEKASEI